MQATYHKYLLQFKKPSGTSRGVLTEKETWFLVLKHNGKIGVGECGLLRTLSIDDRPDYEEKLKWTCENIQLGKNTLWEELIEFPSIQFGVEMAFLSLESDNPFELFPSQFTKSNETMTINGLVWMGQEQEMKAQIEEKLALGFNCIKLKIGAIDFDKELALLAFIRRNFDEKTIEIRVDANGAFDVSNAKDKLIQLSEYKLHSIEQPIKKNKHDNMAELCKSGILPIALDEELIGVFSLKQKLEVIQSIKPQYIILKPSLVGGFKGTLEWIKIAEENNVGWWITSALESNIGLNAITQFTFTLNCSMPQGLGTGGLYINNFESPLYIKKGSIGYNSNESWDLSLASFLSDLA